MGNLASFDSPVNTFLLVSPASVEIIASVYRMPGLTLVIAAVRTYRKYLDRNKDQTCIHRYHLVLKYV